MRLLQIIFIIAVIVISNATIAADASVDLKSIRVDLHNKASLQRGARYFMNYCSGCHSLNYLRYSQMAKDLGLTTFDGSIDSDLLINNLIFTESSAHDPIKIAMPEEDARQWFGRLPPDLSLTARERSADWIYTYLKSFYKDKSRPFGSNNLLVPDVSMPNVLAHLQGEVIGVKRQGAIDVLPDVQLVMVEKGAMTQSQFDSILQDLVTFLVYASEPHKLTRYNIGMGVMIFLLVLAVFAYLLKREYWRKID
jgi:ubiquinol-cytochrome c reductase cytochrome c1 subunit